MLHRDIFYCVKCDVEKVVYIYSNLQIDFLLATRNIVIICILADGQTTCWLCVGRHNVGSYSVSVFNNQVLLLLILC